MPRSRYATPMSLLERMQRECAGVPTFAAMIVNDGDVVLERAADAPLCACSTIKVAVAMAVLAVVQDVAHDIAARVAGVGAFELLRERVLDPLGMTATRPDAAFPRGALATTARDLARLAAELLGGGRVLNAASRAELARVHADSYTASPSRYYGLGVGIERWDGFTLLQHGGGLGRYGSAFVVDSTARAAAALLFDAPAGYSVSPHAYLDAMLERETRAPLARAATVDWRAYLGRYSNGAALADEAGEFVLHWNGARTSLVAYDERVYSGRGRISVGLLPGEPTMISANDFILIGARPGVRVGA
jgi:hypothetical protein